VVRFLGNVASSPARVERLTRKLAGRYNKLQCCYEDGVILARRLLFRWCRRVLRRDGASAHLNRRPAMHYIGIDVSAKESALCILDERGKIVRETKVPTDPEIIARFITDTGSRSSGSAWKRVVPRRGCSQGCSGMARQWSASMRGTRPPRCKLGSATKRP
jgi:hypothetical protein